MQLKKLVQDNGFTSFAFSAKSNVVSTSEFPLPVHVDVTATYNEWSYYFTATIAASCNNKGMMEKHVYLVKYKVLQARDSLAELIVNPVAGTCTVTDFAISPSFSKETALGVPRESCYVGH